MLTFILRRLLAIVAVGLAILYFGFLGINFVARSDLPDNERPPATEVIAIAAEGSADYLTGLFQGDLGITQTRTGEMAIIDIISFAYKNSMALILMAVGAGALIGALLGTVAGLSRRGFSRQGVLFFTLIGISAPAFLLAVLLQTAGIKYTTTVGRQLVSMGGYAWDFKHLAMPLIVLAVRPIAYLTRAAHIAIRSIMDENYIQTAFAKGLTKTRTILTHALKNMAIPYLSAVAVSMRFALSILPIVEFIFAWPGIGRGMLEAINERSPIMFVSMSLALGMTILVVNLLLDLSFRFIDPRLREEV
jgi:ABC-type dipeptide/oligopeptide/nickel transport system permease component